jgi:GTP-binding protein HflX
VAVSARTRQGLDDLRDAVIAALRAEFVDAEVDLPASNGKVMAYLSAHAEIYRQEYDGDRVRLHCLLPGYLVRHIQEPDVHIRVTGADGQAVTPEE